MAMKEQQRQVYRSMQGKEVDMHKLVMQNETALAVGNVKMNARGDLLGPNGEVLQKNEEKLVAPAGGVPNQINVRKDVGGMDPEGNE
jgi:hypothetical protein